MAIRKTSTVDTAQVRHILQSAGADDGDAGSTGARPTAVRLNSREYAYLRRVFDVHGKGLRLSTGIKMAALWIATKVDSGKLLISRAGIIERR